MRNSIRNRLYGGAAIALMLASPALAADNAADTEEAASDIIVTARRTEERLQDVPISISVVSQQQISNRNIVTASDLAVYTPSLTSNNRFGADKSSFIIRGFNQVGKTAPTVAVYFADVGAVRSNSGTGGGNGVGPGAFFDLQNVQVLKGPQGTLFGRNTDGGAILLVPTKPTDRLEGYVEGSIGNYDLKRVQAVLNVPLAETFKVRLGVDRQKRDGYLINKSGRGPKDFADSDYVSARLSIVGELTPDLENYMVASYTRSNTNGSNMYHIGACNTGANPLYPVTGRAVLSAPWACAQIARQKARGDGIYDVENYSPDAFNTTSNWQIINTTTWKATDALTIKNIASYGESRERWIGNIGGEFFILTTGANAGQPVPNVTNFPGPGQYNNITAGYTEELQLQGNSGDNKLRWQAGAYYEKSSPMKHGDNGFSISYLNCANPLTLTCFGPAGLNNLSNVYNKVWNRTIGLYGQATYEFSDKFAVTGGLRYTMDKSYGDGGRLSYQFTQAGAVTTISCVSNPAVVPVNNLLNVDQCRTSTFRQQSKKPTWVIDAEFKPTPDLMLYAKYSRGYRQGGVDPTNRGREFWGPEKVDTYEVGAKTSFSGAVSGYFNLAAFYNDFRDQQLAVTLTGRPGSGISGIQAILNAGKSRIWGIEADGAATLFDSLKLEAGYAYLNTELQEIIVPDFTNTPLLPPNIPTTGPNSSIGQDLPLSPHHRLTATATYTLPLDESIGRISIGATWVYTSSQLGSIQPSPYNTLPSSNLINANVNWSGVAGAPVDLAFFVTNLTKEKFPISVAGNYTGSGYESFIYTPPRMYGVRLRYRFGD